MEDVYQQKKWRWTPHQHAGEQWMHPDFEITITKTHSDGAYATLHFLLRNLPGVVGVTRSTGRPRLRYTHEFSISIPRAYPTNLKDIQVTEKTPLFHPRIGSFVCFYVNGEIDRILYDLVYFVLLKPDRVKPPTLYKTDYGPRMSAMRWYISQMDQIVELLEKEWDAKHQKAPEPKRKVVILDTPTPNATKKRIVILPDPKKKPSILNDSQTKVVTPDDKEDEQ